MNLFFFFFFFYMKSILFPFIHITKQVNNKINYFNKFLYKAWRKNDDLLLAILFDGGIRVFCYFDWITNNRCWTSYLKFLAKGIWESGTKKLLILHDSILNKSILNAFNKCKMNDTHLSWKTKYNFFIVS